MQVVQGFLVTLGLAAMAVFLWQVWLTNGRDIGVLAGRERTNRANWRTLIGSFVAMTICFAIATSPNAP